jgi:hypothetical protein
MKASFMFAKPTNQATNQATNQPTKIRSEFRVTRWKMSFAVLNHSCLRNAQLEYENSALKL